MDFIGAFMFLDYNNCLEVKFTITMQDRITASEYRKSLKPAKSKYGNRKVEMHGKVFDSQKECNRFMELEVMRRCNQISNLELQPKFELIPAQYEVVNGKRRCIERACSYIADFCYLRFGELVVEDTKGFLTKEYRIKRKLMLHVHGIQIKEV